MHACMGGTFDPLHGGHERLLAEALRISDQLFIGVTDDAMAAKGRTRDVAPAEARAQRVRDLLASWGAADRVEVDIIHDATGRADEATFNAIVVSQGTAETARRINEARRADGLDPLAIHIVPFFLALDGHPVNATRVAAGEIDRLGLHPKHIHAAIGSANPVKVDAARAVLERHAEHVTVTPHDVDSGAPEQPHDAETVHGAVQRAKAALEADPDAGLGIGIEAGLQDDPHSHHLWDVQYCAIVDRRGRATLGHGPGFLHPPTVHDVVQAGRTVGDAFDELTGRDGIGRTEGAIGVLTDGTITRKGLTEWAVAMALVPRLSPDLYDPLPEIG